MLGKLASNMRYGVVGCEFNANESIVSIKKVFLNRYAYKTGLTLIGQ